jgi:MFS family permease
VVEIRRIRDVIKGNVLVLTVSSVLWSMSDSITYAYISLYLLSLGGDYVVIGVVNALSSLAAIVLYPIGGYIADKSGRARLVGISTLLYTSSYALFALARSWQWVAFAVIYQQFVLFYMPAINAIMADSIPVGTRGRIYAMTVGLPEAVRVVTPYLGGYLIAILTLQPAMRVGYTIGFSLGCVVAFIRLKYLKETISDKESIGRDLPKILRESYKNAFASIRWMLKNIRGYVAVAVIIAITGNLVLPFWVVYALQVKGISPYEWGIILLMAGATRSIMSFVIGDLVDKIGPKKCMLIGFSMSIPCAVLFVYASGFWQMAPIYLILVVGSAFAWIASSVLLADIIPKNLRGRVMSGIGQGIGLGVSGGGYASGFLLFIPLSIGSALSGYIFTINPTYPWLILAAFMALAAVITILFVHEPTKAES